MQASIIRQTNSGLKSAVSMLVACWVVAAVAFDFSGEKWPGGETEFYFALEGTSGTGRSEEHTSELQSRA